MSDFNHTDHSTTNHSQTPRYRRPKFPWFKNSHRCIDCWNHWCTSSTWYRQSIK